MPLLAVYAVWLTYHFRQSAMCCQIKKAVLVAHSFFGVTVVIASEAKQSPVQRNVGCKSAEKGLSDKSVISGTPH